MLLVDRQALSEHTTTSSSTKSLGQALRVSLVKPGAYLSESYAGQSPEVKQQIVDMAMNASGIRDTARVLHVSPTTVINELKKTRIAK